MIFPDVAYTVMSVDRIRSIIRITDGMVENIEMKVNPMIVPFIEVGWKYGGAHFLNADAKELEK